MNEHIKSLDDVRPGDLVLMPMSGAPAKLLVYLGQLMLGEYFRIGGFVVGHVGIVTEAAIPGIRGPMMVQAMPHGAEEIEMTPEKHWKPGVVFVRLPEDYSGQARDAAAIARAMIGTLYSFVSYLALALWRWGVKTPKLERWIGRQAGELPDGLHRVDTWSEGQRLPAEAICSVLADQAWSLAGKRVCVGVAHQAVTPGRLAQSLFDRPSDEEGRVIWGGAGMLSSK